MKSPERARILRALGQESTNEPVLGCPTVLGQIASFDAAESLAGGETGGKPSNEFLSRPRVQPWLDEAAEHDAIPIRGTPKITPRILDPHEPLIGEERTTVAQTSPEKDIIMILPSNAPKNAFCFAPMFNSPNRMDATGAFLPYMEAFKRLYWARGGSIGTLAFDNHANAESEFATISAGFEQIPGKLDAVVYFGHGEPFGMVSADIYAKDIQKFAQLIRRKSVHGVRVVLYACSSGKFNYPGGSFAAKLAIALTDVGAVVFGHDNVGHTTTNANIYRYSGGGHGVAVAPTGKFDAFDRRLKAESIDQKPRGNNAFWARIPFMTPDEIRAEVGM